MKFNKYLLIAIAAFIISTGAFFIFQEDATAPSSSEDRSCNAYVDFKTTDGDTKRYDLRLAISDQEKIKGLQFIENLPADEGMLFYYQQPVRGGYWMKDVLINLDMVFISQDLEIIDVFSDLPPCDTAVCESYAPGRPYQYVVELNGGQAKANGIEVGSELNELETCQ